jgi:hypothetical protein
VQGKSFVIHAANQYAETRGLHALTAAPMAAAASLIGGARDAPATASPARMHPPHKHVTNAMLYDAGQTMHSAVVFHVLQKYRYDPMSNTRMKEVQERHADEEVWGCVLDEISAVGPSLFVPFENRLRAVFRDHETDFAGLPVFIFGVRCTRAAV